MKNKFLAKLLVVFAALSLPLTACDLSSMMGGGRTSRETSTSQESTNQESTTNTTSDETYTLSSIQVTRQPDKLRYLTGDTLDTTGIEVTAHFKPAKNEVISTNDLVFDYDFSSTGTKIVTVSYTYNAVTKNTTFTVTVTQRPAEGSVTLDFYTFNDWHGNILDTSLSIGIAKTSTFIKQKTQNQNALLISSGDMWQGSMESNSTRGKLMMEWMEYMNFTSMTIGNHEFDWGKEVIKKNAQDYNVPILGINIIDKNTHQRADYVTPSTIVERGGAKIGIIGAIGDCYGSVSYSQVMDVSFVLDNPNTNSYPLTDLVKAESRRLRQQEGCDFIVYSFHGDSVHNDTYYNTELSTGGYVDVVLEGHKHVETYYQDDGGVWHFQCNADGTMAINHFAVNLNPSTHEYTVSFTESNDAYRMNSSDKYNLPEDAGAVALINKYDFSSAYQTIGYNSYNRSGNEMRQKCVDLYLSYGLTKWASTLSQDVVLAGGYISIRGDGYLKQGGITYANLYSLFPFDNDIVLIQITGSSLKTVYFDTTNSNYFMSYTSYGNSLKDNPSSLVANDLYYVICDTYSSDWMLKVGHNPIIVDRYEEDGCFARDLFADYAKKGGFDESGGGGGETNPWDDVALTHDGTQENPYNVSEAYKLARTSVFFSSNYSFIKGKVSDLSDAAISNGRITGAVIIDIEEGHQDLALTITALSRYCGATSENGFKSINELSVGDEIVVYARADYVGDYTYLTNDTAAVLINNAATSGLTIDNPTSVISYILVGDDTNTYYVQGLISNITTNDLGNFTSFYLGNENPSLVSQYEAFCNYALGFNDNISIADGIQYSNITPSSTIIVRISGEAAHIARLVNAAPVGDPIYRTNTLTHENFLAGTTQTTVNAYNSLSESALITLTHSAMSIGYDREDAAYNNLVFKIQSNGFMCITAPSGYKVTQVYIRICYTYDNFDFYAGTEVNESNRLEEQIEKATSSPWWTEYTVAANSESVYIYNTYSGGAVNCYELNITIQAI